MKEILRIKKGFVIELVVITYYVFVDKDGEVFEFITYNN